MQELFEVADVAAALGLSTSRVRCLSDEGKLRIAALTPRGLRLFDPRDVERLKVERDRSKPGSRQTFASEADSPADRLLAGART